MIVFSCNGSICSAKIRIEEDNDKNFKCPKCNKRYDADEGKHIYFNEELDIFLRENLEWEEYLRLQGNLEDDTYFYKSEESILKDHIFNCKKKVSKEEFKINLKEFINRMNEIIYQIPEPPKPLNLFEISKKMENKRENILKEPLYRAHEILLYEAEYYDHLEKGLGKNPNSMAHDIWNEQNEKNKHDFSWRISFLKEIWPEFNLEEHRKKFKAVRSKEYGGFEIKNNKISKS